jgi:hypothetical protein
MKYISGIKRVKEGDVGRGMIQINWTGKRLLRCSRKGEDINKPEPEVRFRVF